MIETMELSMVEKEVGGGGEMDKLSYSHQYFNQPSDENLTAAALVLF